MLARDTASPAQALEWIRRGDPFDLAILDMQMPEMDGVMLAGEIGRYRDARALPLVMLTSLGSWGELRGDVEFAAFLTKPIKPSQLYDTLMSLFGPAPAGVQAAAPREGPVEQLAERLPLRILVAEDNVVNQQVALLLLKKLGYRADMAADGLEALQALERESYDVVLMDVQMPELDGLEATRRIRDRFGSAGPTIIAMTANAMEGDREKCLAAGMDDYLAKPIRPEELAGALARCRPRQGAGAVDLETLDRLVSSLGGGDEGREAVAELVDAFLDDGAAQMTTLRAAVERGDAEEAMRAAHTLKSNGATFGAQPFAKLCRELEALGRSGRLDAADALVEQAEEEWGRVRESLGAARLGR
jgi:CheY-like chemotaxis protein